MIWLIKLSRALGYTVAIVAVVWLLFQPFSVVGLLVTAMLGEATGWYRIEDSMCTLPEGCKEYIAERKLQREQNKPLQNSK
jgi:hypothetical protein